MSTAAVTPAAPQHNGFVRFIDAIGHVFVKAAPVVEEAAVEAEPIMALSPFGPEYAIAVNAIVGAQKVASASLAAGVNLTGQQKFGIAVASATPALDTILKSRGVADDTETHVNNWIQLVFNLLSGPLAKVLVNTVKNAGTTVPTASAGVSGPGVGQPVAANA